MSTKNKEIGAEIGQRIKKFRKNEGMTLVQLANLIGISHGSLSGLENGKSKPSAETLSNFCLHTEINIVWLLTGNGPAKLANLRGLHGKYEILNQAEKWLDEQVQKNPDRKIWFELNLLDAFPAFKEWRENKGEISKKDTEFRKQANGGGWE